jgi:hypothetical protein
MPCAESMWSFIPVKGRISGLHNQLVACQYPRKGNDSNMKVKSRLGGLLNYYYR